VKKSFNYFYRTENKIDGRFYYGVHKTNNLEDGYMGSGTRIIRAIKKYGIENFNKEILLFFDTFENALDYEAEIVNEQLLLDPSCYNIRLGGESHWFYYNKTGLNVHHKKKGRGTWLDLETNKKITASSEIENNEFRQSKRYVGLTKGKFLVKDSKNNIFLVEKTDERYITGKLIPLWRNKKHSDKTRIQMRKTHHKNGDQKGYKNSQYGTCWITNEKENKKIHKGDLVPDGWKLGRKLKH
jgi:hypothetical protein